MSLMLLVLYVISAVYGGQSSVLFSSDINVSEGCRAAVQRLSSLQATEPQLMARYWDSWGKPSDSILIGHATFLGYYDECMNLKNTDLGDMKYCIYPMIMDTSIMQSSNEIEGGVCHSSNCSMPVNTSTKLDVKVGVCYPSACSADEFAAVLSKMSITSVTTMTSDPFSDTTNTIAISFNIKEKSHPFCPLNEVEYDASTIAVIVLCVILVGLVVVATAVDIVLWALSSNIKVTTEARSELTKSFPRGLIRENLSEATKKANIISPTMKDFVLAFSLYNTVPNLLQGQSPSALKALSAIKILSNITIITLHVQQLIVIFFSATSQNSYLQHVFSSFIFQPVTNVTLAVETFFVVSGTLSAYLTFKDMEKHKRFRFKYFYLNRFFRLSPMLYFYTLVSYKLTKLFGQGPVWFPFDAHACMSTWKYVLLYLANTDYNQSGMMFTCMAPTWHIAAEMQLFIFSPIFIILLYCIQYVGLAAVAMAMIAVTATVGYVSVTNGYWAAMMYNPQIAQQATELYNKAFFRTNSYLTGILLGYILYKKYSIATLPITNYSKLLVYVLLWVVGITLCLVTMFGTYGEYSFTYHFSDMENVIYLMFSGLAWSIGIAIIIYICNTGYGGVVNSFLSWPGWEPLVKLNYGVSLNHVITILCIVGTLQSGVKYTNTVFVMIVVFTVVMSYSIAVITAVFIEQPISRVVFLCFKLAGIEVRSR